MAGPSIMSAQHPGLVWPSEAANEQMRMPTAMNAPAPTSAPTPSFGWKSSLDKGVPGIHVQSDGARTGELRRVLETGGEYAVRNLTEWKNAATWK
jgi:hypothetical protein